MTEELIEARRVSKQRRNLQQKGGSELADLSHLAAAQPSDVPVTRVGEVKTERERVETGD